MNVRIGTVGLVSLAMLLGISLPAFGQVVRPEPPKSYDVFIRYRIRAGQEQRIIQFNAMQDYLNKLGFTATPRPDADLDKFDKTAEYTDGSIPAENVLQLLDEPNIKTIVFKPVGVDWKPDAKAISQVRIGLPSNLAKREQYEFHQQVVALLGRLDFTEAVGYDTNNYSLIRGALPTGHILKLLNDLRTQPAGWFFSETLPDELPLPLKRILPIRWVELLPDVPTAKLPAVDAKSKFTAEIQEILAKPEELQKPVIVEAILEAGDQIARNEARYLIQSAAPGASLEGLVGGIATIRLKQLNQLNRLASYPEIRHIRLLRTATATVSEVETPQKAADFLKESQLSQLHQLGYRGQGQSIVIIGAEFPNLSAMLGKSLPKSTQFLDITGEDNSLLESQPANVDLPSSVSVAVAAHLAAPDAQLVLVRVDPSALHQVQSIARAISGDVTLTDALAARSEELVTTIDLLAAKRVLVQAEYREAFANLSDDEAPAKRRRDAAKAFENLKAEEAAFSIRQARFAAIKDGLLQLRGSSIVVNSLVWEEGYPHDGLSGVSRLLDLEFSQAPNRSAIKQQFQATAPSWVQAASASTEQLWSGPYRDTNANGILEFRPSDQPFSNNLWTHELNGLGYQPVGQAMTTTLAKGLRLRVSLQWREAYDPAEVVPEDSEFPLTIRLLKQLDPSGKVLSTDEFIEVDRSQGKPLRLLKTNGSATFEQHIDVIVPEDGVYFLQVEGRQLEPVFAPQRASRMEIYPRLSLTMPLDSQKRQGKVVLVSSPVNHAGVGIPGDNAASLTIGVAEAQKSITGFGPSVSLGVKPDLVTFGDVMVGDQAYRGPGVAAGYAGGLAACLKMTGVRTTDLVKNLGLKAGSPLVLPSAWLQSISPRSTIEHR